MTSKTVTIGSKVGLHARPASVFAQAVAECGVAVMLTDAEGKTVNAASILSVLSMGIGYGDRVTLSSDDENAPQALASLAQLLASELDDEKPTAAL
ncbi:HPr family phosphocarrier protein [Salinibacterium sp. UTAS2018]|uniref:HPr family phosphocarrier protein n=1 Tax=Salinibacterium sp. UTAS2018 TaxID=2508880 RepID=UPI0010094D0C|nr:HPr family phosphocarrier protein [Salinibacterium sp. UTAS2018]QAV69461.1 HPr family phosphocarrier protein [Salinibacterium sp. UTAS2018]